MGLEEKKIRKGVKIGTRWAERNVIIWNFVDKTGETVLIYGKQGKTASGKGEARQTKNKSRQQMTKQLPVGNALGCVFPIGKTIKHRKTLVMKLWKGKR